MTSQNPLAQKLVDGVGAALATYAMPPEQRGISGVHLISYARKSYLQAHTDEDQKILDFMVVFDSRISSQVPYTFLRKAASGAFTVNEEAISKSFAQR